MFSGTFNGTNDLTHQQNTVWKTDKIVSESEIVSRKGQTIP